jgi:MSHA biogenesis protein MshP
MRRAQSQGFGAIAALVVLVLLAILAATVVRFSTSGSAGLAQDVQAARAQAAARAGVDWGMYQLLQGSWVGCDTPRSQTLDLRSQTGMRVTVSCAGIQYLEGEGNVGTGLPLYVYRLVATACNGSAATCPDNASATRPQYVERERVVTVSER